MNVLDRQGFCETASGFCERERKSGKRLTRMPGQKGYRFNRKRYTVTENGTVDCDNKRYTVTENGIP